MTIALMIFATAAAYAAGIATMLRRELAAIDARRADPARMVAAVGQGRAAAKAARADPFAVRAEAKAKAVEPPRKRLLHWPAAKPEPEPLSEPQSEPAASAGPARACLPENKWRSP